MSFVFCEDKSQFVSIVGNLIFLVFYFDLSLTHSHSRSLVLGRSLIQTVSEPSSHEAWICCPIPCSPTFWTWRKSTSQQRLIPVAISRISPTKTESTTVVKTKRQVSKLVGVFFPGVRFFTDRQGVIFETVAGGGEIGQLTSAWGNYIRISGIGNAIFSPMKIRVWSCNWIESISMKLCQPAEYIQCDVRFRLENDVDFVSRSSE